MEENFVLTPEILGPILKESYWASVVHGTPSEGTFPKMARLALQKLTQVIAHKTHHKCMDSLGDSSDHYMYFGCLITKVSHSLSWNAYGVTNRWICSGSEADCLNSVEKMYKPVIRKPESEC